MQVVEEVQEQLKVQVALWKDKVEAQQAERAKQGAEEGEEGREGCGGGEEVEEKVKEVALWDARVAELERETALVQQATTRWPASGQREKEVEKRLRSLSEQLRAKQVGREGWWDCTYPMYPMDQP